jgi:nitrite reductase/ring-hydroxylating ferredoxin subunit
MHSASIDTDPREALAVPGHWYAIALSENLRRKPRAVRRFGEDLVIWRDGTDRVVGMIDRCPHKGAALSDGRVVDGCIQCPYHGFRYDPEGRCVAMPCDGPDARIPGRFGPDTVEVREQHGFVWLWWGDPRPTLPEIPWFEELDQVVSEGASWATYAHEWPITFGRQMEMAFDLHHLPFVHRRTVPGVPEFLDPCEVGVAGDRIRLRGRLRAAGATTGSRRGMSVDLSVRFPSLFLNSIAKNFWEFSVCAPVDRERCWHASRFYLAWPMPRWARAGLVKLMAAYEKRFVFPEDMRIAARQRPRNIGIRGDRLVARADGGVVAYHRMWMAAFRRGHDEQFPLAEPLELERT